MNAPEPLAAIERRTIDDALWLPVDLVQPSDMPSQRMRRSHFNKDELERLADNVGIHGVQSPILVRPLPDAKRGAPLYEIVAGERRWLASKMAELAEVPAIVRSLTNVQVVELQMSENLHRTDLHPLEEAEGYSSLIRERQATDAPITAEAIADRIGKSRRHVFNRLKLLDLIPSAREQLLAGKLSATVALLVARLQVSDQAEAAKLCIQGWGGESWSYRQAAEQLEQRYMLQLSKAPFRITDANLVPAAGSCRECPKRTGANPDLFDDIKNGDTCTDSACFQSKVKAHHEQLVAQAQEKGLEVITGAAAKKVMPHQHGDLKGYLPLDKVQYNISDKPLRKLLGKDAPATVLIENPHTKDLMEVVRESEALQVLKDKGHIKSAKAAPSTNASQRKAEAQAKAATAWRTVAVEQALAAVMDTPAEKAADLASFMWPEIAMAMWDRLDNDNTRRVEKLVGWEHIDSSWSNPKADSQKEQRIRALVPNELARLLVAMCLASDSRVGPNQSAGSLNKAPRLERFAKQLGVDIAQIRKDVAAGVIKPGAKKKQDATEAFVEAHGVRPAAAPAGVKYWNAETGETWSGRGKQPAWIRQAVADGQKLDDFLVPATSDEAAP